MEFSKTIFRAWKVLENERKVMEFLQLFARLLNRYVKQVICYALNRRQSISLTMTSNKQPIVTDCC